MRLHDVANAFNNLPMFDGYSGVLVGNGQLDPWDGNKRDGIMGERRTLSLDPVEIIPVRRVIACVNTRFILGKGSSDDWRGTVIRTGYVAHEATYLSQVRTLEQVCLASAGFTAWSARVWDKDILDAAQSSELTAQNALHFAVDEPILENHVVTFNGRLNVVRSVDFGAVGTLVATCEQMVEPTVQSGVLMSGLYDPISDAVVGSPITLTVIRMRWQSLFAYSTGMAPKFQPGDIQVVIAKVAATPIAGATLELPDGLWRLESVLSEGSVWLCRATHYA